jgi:osmotically-inducible protein OsmY
VRTDSQTRSNVIEELVWEPATQAITLRVKVKDGHVVLSGFTDNFSQRWHAEQAAMRAQGAISVENQIEVSLCSAMTRSDAEIEHAIKTSLRWMNFVSSPGIDVVVHHGVVTLSGTVHWVYLKQAITMRLCYLMGIKDVHNNISVTAEKQNCSSIATLRSAESHVRVKNISAAQSRHQPITSQSL